MDHETIGLQTLRSLEERLSRLHFLLHGDEDVSNATASTASSNPQAIPVAAQLQKLERSMQTLSDRSETISRLLQLQNKHPQIFQPQDPIASDNDLPDPSTLAALVLSHAPSYSATASRLASLNDLSIPDATASADLAALMPRLEGLRAVEMEQEEQIVELRARSAAVVERWYATGIMGMGECWSDWEGRLMDVERVVRQEQGRRKREKDAV